MNEKSLFFVFMLGIFLFSCQQSKESKTKSSNSVFKTRVIAEQGELIHPIYLDSSEFVGFPGALTEHPDDEKESFLVMGQHLQLGKRYGTLPIASINYLVGGRKRKLTIAQPIDSRYKTIDFQIGSDFNLEFSAFKLWIQDWITSAYREKGVKIIGWETS